LQTHTTKNNHKITNTHYKHTTRKLATYTFEIILSYSSNANSLQTCNNLDVLKFKNRNCMKYGKRVTIRIYKKKQVKSSFFTYAMTGYTRTYSLIGANLLMILI
jgi:ribosomal protein L32